MFCRIRPMANERYVYLLDLYPNLRMNGVAFTSQMLVGRTVADPTIKSP